MIFSLQQLYKKNKNKTETPITNRNFQMRIKNIENELDSLEKVQRIILVFHNIDGQNLLDEKTQEILSLLAKIKKVTIQTIIF